jgi:hypothetical protein
MDSLVIEKRFEYIKQKNDKIDLFGLEKIRKGRGNFLYLIYTKLNMIIKIDENMNVQWVYKKYGKGPGELNNPSDVFEKDSLLYIANQGQMNIIVLHAKKGNYIGEINLSNLFLRPEQICILNNYLIIKPVTVIFPGGNNGNSPLVVSFPLKTPLSIMESRKHVVRPESFGSFIADAIINNTVEISIYKNQLYLFYKLGNNVAIAFDEELNKRGEFIFPVSNQKKRLLKKRYNIKNEHEIKTKIPIICKDIQVNARSPFFLNDNYIYLFSFSNSEIDTLYVDTSLDLMVEIRNKWFGYDKEKGILYLFKRIRHENKQTILYPNDFFKHNDSREFSAIFYFVTTNCIICKKILGYLQELVRHGENIFIVCLPEDPAIDIYKKSDIPIIIDVKHELYKRYNRELGTKIVILNKFRKINELNFIELTKLNSAKDLLSLLR